MSKAYKSLNSLELWKWKCPHWKTTQRKLSNFILASFSLGTCSMSWMSIIKSREKLHLDFKQRYVLVCYSLRNTSRIWLQQKTECKYCFLLELIIYFNHKWKYNGKDADIAPSCVVVHLLKANHFRCITIWYDECKIAREAWLSWPRLNLLSIPRDNHQYTPDIKQNKPRAVDNCVH